MASGTVTMTATELKQYTQVIVPTLQRTPEYRQEAAFVNRVLTENGIALGTANATVPYVVNATTGVISYDTTDVNNALHQHPYFR